MTTGTPNPLTQPLLRFVDDGLWANPWHSLAEATRELSDGDIDYRPVAGVTGHWAGDMARPLDFGARAIFRHLIGATLEAGAPMPEPAEPLDTVWNDLEPFDWECGVKDLIRAADIAHQDARARAAMLTDSSLWDECTPAPPFTGFSNAEVVAQCLVLHPSWHLGQLALLPKWRRMGAGQPPLPAAPTQEEHLTPCGDWPYHMPPVENRRDMLLELLRQAQETCPWHALDRAVAGLTGDEATWEHHPATAQDQALPISFYCMHIATCDVIYTDQAFGERRNDWDWAGRIVGVGEQLPPSEAPAAMCRRGYEFLVDRIQAAPEESFDAVHPMHHGHPMTGWQVVATMVQHRLWHAGQIAMIRAAFTGANA